MWGGVGLCGAVLAGVGWSGRGNPVLGSAKHMRRTAHEAHHCSCALQLQTEMSEAYLPCGHKSRPVHCGRRMPGLDLDRGAVSGLAASAGLADS